MIHKRIELENLHDRMTGVLFDIEYSSDAIKSLGNSDGHFNVSSFLFVYFIIDNKIFFFF